MACFSGPKAWPIYVREHSVKPPEEVLAHIRHRYDQVESLDVSGDGCADDDDRVFVHEGAELPDAVRAYFEGHPDEMETVVVDYDWWAKLTSA